MCNHLVKNLRHGIADYAALTGLSGAWFYAAIKRAGGLDKPVGSLGPGGSRAMGFALGLELQTMQRLTWNSLFNLLSDKIDVVHGADKVRRLQQEIETLTSALSTVDHVNNPHIHADYKRIIEENRATIAAINSARGSHVQA